MRAHEARGIGIVAIATTAIVGGMSLFAGNGDTNAGSTLRIASPGSDLDAANASAATGPNQAASTLPTVSTPSGGSTATVSDSPADSEPVVDLVGDEPTGEEPCVLDDTSLRLGDTGDDVTCLQQALVADGLLDGEVTGEFDQATNQAVTQLQTDRELFVDGVVGRETALSLGIWPDEQANVIRTPPPAPGAVDALGFPLSSVASTGDEAPPLPPDSGSGRRLVYERAGQRVWAVDDDGSIIRSWLVSGSKYNNELPGTHEVYSRSEESTAWNGQGRLPKMVRWLKTEIGAIGFHGLPTRIADGSAYQTEAELGTRLSGGCQRQADLDADFTWDFAQVGTPVVVL